MADKQTIDELDIVNRIDDGVWLLESLQEIEKVSLTSAAIRIEHNMIIFCRRGRVMLEIGGEKQVKVNAGQLLLLPAEKLLHPMMVSTDVDVTALIFSAKALRTILGPQIGIWNMALYMKGTYVIDGEGWTGLLREQTSVIFKNNELRLKQEITESFLRTLLLMVCEQLLNKDTNGEEDQSTDRDKVLFNQFLTLVEKEQQKRHQVAYYAEKLYISPKYLSTVCTRVSGKSPMRWITDSVMEQCYTMLKTTSLSVKEISNRLGFPNPSFFGQYFRDEAGMTPMEYRRGRGKGRS